MTRLEIPALYRHDVGNKRWGWYKMDELRLSVGGLFKEVASGLPEGLREGSVDGIPTAQALLRVYGHLCIEPKLGFTDGVFINFAPPYAIPCERPNLYVTAQWGLCVIIAIKTELNPGRHSSTALYRLTRHCLTENEKRVMELRLGIAGGKRTSLKAIGKDLNCSGDYIRKVEAVALEKMRQEELFPLCPGDETDQKPPTRL